MKPIVDILNDMDFRKKSQWEKIDNLTINLTRKCFWRKLGPITLNPVMKLVDILVKKTDIPINFYYEFEYPWRESRFTLAPEASPFEEFPTVYMNYKLCDDIEDSYTFTDNSIYYVFGSGMSCRSITANANIEVLKLAYALTLGKCKHFRVKDRYVLDVSEEGATKYFSKNEITLVSTALEDKYVQNYEIEVNDDYIDDDEKELIEYAREFMKEREKRKAELTKKEVSV